MRGAHRLFISAKTVGHDMSAILAKLGVRSRQEEVRAVDVLLTDQSSA